MKKKIVNRSLLILVLTVFFGLFQAWKESKNPFAFHTNHKNKIEKFKPVSNKYINVNAKNDFKLYSEE